VEMEFGEMKRNTSNWSISAIFWVARVCQRQLGFLVWSPTCYSYVEIETASRGPGSRTWAVLEFCLFNFYVNNDVCEIRLIQKCTKMHYFHTQKK